MSGRTRLVRAGGLAALVALAAVAVAHAHEASFRSSVSIEFCDPNCTSGADYLGGYVDSPRLRCERGRTVKLYRNTSTLVGSDETSPDSEWIVGQGTDLGSGEYRAIVTREETGSGSHRHVCRRDGSAIYVLSPP